MVLMILLELLVGVARRIARGFRGERWVGALESSNPKRYNHSWGLRQTCRFGRQRWRVGHGECWMARERVVLARNWWKE